MSINVLDNQIEETSLSRKPNVVKEILNKNADCSQHVISERGLSSKTTVQANRINDGAIDSLLRRDTTITSECELPRQPRSQPLKRLHNDMQSIPLCTLQSIICNNDFTSKPQSVSTSQCDDALPSTSTTDNSTLNDSFSSSLIASAKPIDLPLIDFSNEPVEAREEQSQPQSIDSIDDSYNFENEDIIEDTSDDENTPPPSYEDVLTDRHNSRDSRDINSTIHYEFINQSKEHSTFDTVI